MSEWEAESGKLKTEIRTPDNVAGSGVSASSTQLSASIPPGSPPVPGWHIHRRLYDWVLGLAHKRYATWGLFLLSFAESSVFPIPPDVLQIALTLERRLLAWWYAAVSTAGSVAGGVAGYLIGWGLWEAVSEYFYRHIFSEEVFQRVQGLYTEWGFWIVFIAAFTPIPYKVFTIASGVMGVPLPLFVIGSAVGRGGRFFLVATLLYWLGPPVKRFIERYFNLLTLIATALLIIGIIVYRVMR